MVRYLPASVSLPCESRFRGSSPGGMRMHGQFGSQCHGERLLHAAPQDLVGRNQHHAYNKGHGKCADKALPYTGLSVLLLGVHCRKDKRKIIASYNHRMAWVGRGLKDHLVPTSCHRGLLDEFLGQRNIFTFHWDRLSSEILLLLNVYPTLAEPSSLYFKDPPCWPSTTSPWRPLG